MVLRAIAVIAAGVFATAHAADNALLIRNVTLIDGTGQPPLPHASVLVVGERIALVSPSEIKAPPGATVIDGKGKYLMPGIINSHIHLAGGRTGPGNHELVMNIARGTEVMHGLLYAGVTAIYDSGNYDNYIFEMRDEEQSGRIVGPRLFATGKLLTLAKGYQCCSGGLQVTDYEGTLPALDALIARKPDMVKFTREQRGMGLESENLPLIPLDVMTRLINHVHEAGLRTTVHVGEERYARESIAAGIDALAHPVYLEPADLSFARLVAAKRIPVSTTLGRTDNDVSVLDRPIFLATSPKEEIADNKATYGGKTPTSAWRASLMPIVERNVRQLYDAGAILALGTDRSLAAYVHREMELLAEAGIPNLAITRIATLNAAIYMGKDQDLGSIERGKLADLLLLSADPVADIRNTVKIDAVFKGGKRIDRAALALPAR
jgi:imidazolonepropionase-like amidohydrolase